MSQVAPDTETGENHYTGYSGNLEYLSDELKRLDLLLQMKLLKQRRPANLLDQFRGLVLTEEEVGKLLLKPAISLGGDDITGSDDSEDEALVRLLGGLESEIQHRRAISLKAGTYLSLPHVCRIFHLTPFEERCLLVCLAPELNRKYEKLYAYLQDDVTCRKPSVDLLLSLACNTTEEQLAARMSFDPRAPLLKYRLLEITGNSPDGFTPLLSRLVKLDDRIVSLLLGSGQMDGRLEPIALLVSSTPDAEQVGAGEEILKRAVKFVRSQFNEAKLARHSLVLYFYGQYGSGTRLLSQSICSHMGFSLVVADVGKMLAGPLPFEEAMWLLGRESMLQPAALCLENFDLLLTEERKYYSEFKSLVEVIRTFSRMTFLLGRRPWKPQELFNEEVFVNVQLPVPDEKARAELWEAEADKNSNLADDVDFGPLASKFRLTPGQINDAFTSARALALWRSPENDLITMADLNAACRAQSNPKIESLAQKIDPKYVWDDIVLPPDQLAQIKEICDRARFRHIVYGDWGFDRKLSLGKGLNVLFSGPPGTGKTMASEIIANELQLDLYKIDLSQIVSKYIGETEKNLRKVFDEAQASGTILFFDEADALFGKRSEVKDAHDRYANIEIGYLLQKMEEFDGVAILATNLRHNMDDAFVRRIQFIVEFPFPDEANRRRIWEMAFPRQAPIASDVDLGVLAREVKLAGANIKNIVLAAAFNAASEGGVIRMPHLTRAARREFQKLGRTWNEVEGNG